MERFCSSCESRVKMEEIEKTIKEIEGLIAKNKRAKFFINKDLIVITKFMISTVKQEIELIKKEFDKKTLKAMLNSDLMFGD